MQDPEKQLKEYIEILTYNFVYINGILIQINKFHKWYSEKGPEAINAGLFFYKLSLFSFKRILTIESYKMLSEDEERSLVDFLRKACIHANSLEPSRYEPSQGYEENRRKLETIEYRKIIGAHLETLSDYDEMFNNLKTLRDKGFTHADKEYFENNGQLERDYPVSWEDFNTLFDSIGEILREHYSLLLHADMSMELDSARNIENILMNTRGFQRVWGNKKLIELGVRLASFKADDYDPEDIMM